MTQLSDYEKKKKELEEKKETLQKKSEEKHNEYVVKQADYDRVNTMKHHLQYRKREAKRFVKRVGGVLLRGRDPRQLYSATFKLQSEVNRLKPFRAYLYNYGMEKTILQEFRNLLSSRSKYQKKAAAVELLKWHANQYTRQDAKETIELIKLLVKDEKNKNLLRVLGIIEAEALTILGQADLAKQTLNKLLALDEHPDLYLGLASLEEDFQTKINLINKAYEWFDLSPIKLDDSKEIPYEKLITVATDQPVNDGPKVSIIIPVYNDESGIQTAVESLRQQTWRNIEILIVDDQSTDDTFEVVKKYALIDERIKVFQTPQNSGPYRARNIALKASEGEFFTVHDSDDWSHPKKIQTQVEHLIRNPNIVANSSTHARLSEDLVFFRRGQFGKYLFPNMSSLMFKKEQVLLDVGYWDEVRFAADSEYKRRLIKRFGKDRVVDLRTGPLSFLRQASGSLTANSAFGYEGFFKGVRKEYLESLQHFHTTTDQLYIDAQPDQRPFPAPYPMLPEREKGPRDMDVVLVADYRKFDKNIYQEMKQFIHEGYRVGLVQLCKFDFKYPFQMNEKFRNLIDGDQVQVLVYGEEIHTKLTIIYDISVLYEEQKYIPMITTLTLKTVVFPETFKTSKKQPVQLASHRLLQYFNKKGKWYPLTEQVRNTMNANHQREVTHIELSAEDWYTMNDEDKRPMMEQLGR